MTDHAQHRHDGTAHPAAASHEHHHGPAQPMATGITFGTGFMMTPAVAAVFMSLSTVIVAINAQFLRGYRRAV